MTVIRSDGWVAKRVVRLHCLRVIEVRIDTCNLREPIDNPSQLDSENNRHPVAFTKVLDPDSMILIHQFPHCYRQGFVTWMVSPVVTFSPFCLMCELGGKLHPIHSLNGLSVCNIGVFLRSLLHQMSQPPLSSWVTWTRCFAYSNTNLLQTNSVIGSILPSSASRLIKVEGHVGTLYWAMTKVLLAWANKFSGQSM